MIEQQGQVVRIRGGQAWVRMGPQSGCPTCAAGEGCGAGLFGRLLRRGDVTVPVAPEGDARVGEVVMVGLPEPVFLGLVLRLYGAPLAAGLAGALLSHQLMGDESWSVGARDLVTLVAGLLAAAFALRLSTNAIRRSTERLALVMVGRGVKAGGCPGQPGIPAAGPGTDDRRYEVKQ